MIKFKAYMNESIFINSIIKISLPLTLLTEIVNLRYSETYTQDFTDYEYYEPFIKKGILDKQFMIQLNLMQQKINDTNYKIYKIKLARLYFKTLSQYVQIDDLLFASIISENDLNNKKSIISISQVLLDNVKDLPRIKTKITTDKQLLKLIIKDFKTAISQI
jgi:hypothetical protein